MTSRQLFLGLSFLLLGTVFLLCNRMLAEEVRRWQDALPKLPRRTTIGPLGGRIFIVISRLVSMTLGLLLLARIIS